MAYDEQLADRIRQFIGSDPELTEREFSAGAFLIRGTMAIAASGEGGAMVRVDPAQSDALGGDNDGHVGEHARPGYARIAAVSSDDLGTDDQLAPWVEIDTVYARLLPPK